MKRSIPDSEVALPVEDTEHEHTRQTIATPSCIVLLLLLPLLLVLRIQISDRFHGAIVGAQQELSPNHKEMARESSVRIRTLLTRS